LNVSHSSVMEKVERSGNMRRFFGARGSSTHAYTGTEAINP